MFSAKFEKQLAKFAELDSFSSEDSKEYMNKGRVVDRGHINYRGFCFGSVDWDDGGNSRITSKLSDNDIDKLVHRPILGVGKRNGFNIIDQTRHASKSE